MNKAKRFLSALLALLLCVGIFPSAAAYADWADGAAETAECTDPAPEAADPEEPAAPQSVEVQEDSATPEDGDGDLPVPGLRLVRAAGYREASEENEETHTYTYYHVVTADAGDLVSLYVTMAGAEPADLVYSWYEYHGWSMHWIDGPVIPAFTPEVQTGTWHCDITDGSGTRITVFFLVKVSPPPVTLLPHDGITRYVSVPGVPVTLQADLPDGVNESDCMLNWFALNEKGETAGPPFSSGNTAAVRPTVSTEYAVNGYDNASGAAFRDLRLSVEVLPPAQFSVLEQDYYALGKNESFDLPVPEVPAYWAVTYSWTPENSLPTSGSGDVIRITQSGGTWTVTAAGEGTAFATLVLYDTDSGAELLKRRCRIDVTEAAVEDALVTENYPTGVRLPGTAATVNLYSTDYARFEVQLDLENNQNDQVETASVFLDSEAPAPDNTGWAVTEAEFTDPDTREAFSLRVVDDRTLEIVPNIDFTASTKEINAAVKGSYRSAVQVRLRDAAEPLVTTITGKKGAEIQQLALTVKKTLPKVTAAAVKFNSFLEGDTRLLSFSPACWTVRPDPAYANPDWLEIDPDSMTLTFTGAKDRSCSGKLHLLVRPEGCAAEVPVAVSVKAAKSAPKLKVSGQLTVNPNDTNFACTTVSVTPQEFAGRQIRVTKIAEGNKVWSEAAGTLYEAPISCRLDRQGSWYLYVGIQDEENFDVGRAHTFKVTLDLDGVTAAATVKTLAKRSSMALKVKLSGTIDPTVRGSHITADLTGSNTQGLSVSFRFEAYKGKDKVDHAPDPFVCSPEGGFLYSIRESAPGAIAEGYTYYLIPQLCSWEYEEGSYIPVPVTVFEGAKVRLNIKASAVRPKITTTLKASGSIDLIRPATAITLRVSPLKNCWTEFGFPFPFDDEYLSFSTDKAGDAVIEGDALPFTVEMTERLPDGTAVFSLSLKESFRNDAGLLPTSRYYVRVLIPAGPDTDGQEVSTRPVQLKLTKGKAKITQNVRSVQLLKNDRFSCAEIGVIVPAGFTDVRDITLDAVSGKRFDRVYNGSGSVELRYKGNRVTPGKATVKLNVFLAGNNTAKPDAVLKVSVSIV